MLMVNRYGKFSIEKRQELQQKEQGDKYYIDKKKYETDLNYFKDWFTRNDELLRKKYIYFYIPYMEKNSQELVQWRKNKIKVVKFNDAEQECSIDLDATFKTKKHPQQEHGDCHSTWQELNNQSKLDEQTQFPLQT